MVMRCSVCGRPRLLDTFAGEGGAGEGYRRAGFCVSAVDNSAARLARYRLDCPGAEVVEADAVAYIVDHGHRYALRHASPTCTGYSRGTAAIPDRVSRYDRLIPAVREALQLVGGPYVIENVEDARGELVAPLRLCWTEFYRPGSVLDSDGTPLQMRRHRLFESSLPLMGAGGCRHAKDVQVAGAYGGARRDKWEARHVRRGGYVPASLHVLRDLLGTPWMSEKGCHLSIPPAYTEHLGRQAIDRLGAVVAP